MIRFMNFLNLELCLGIRSIQFMNLDSFLKFLRLLMLASIMVRFAWRHIVQLWWNVVHVTSWICQQSSGFFSNNPHQFSVAFIRYPVWFIAVLNFVSNHPPKLSILKVDKGTTVFFTCLDSSLIGRFFRRNTETRTIDSKLTCWAGSNFFIVKNSTSVILIVSIIGDTTKTVVAKMVVFETFAFITKSS